MNDIRNIIHEMDDIGNIIDKMHDIRNIIAGSNYKANFIDADATTI